MIPYFELLSFSIGPLTIQVWGLLVVLGMLVGLLLTLRLAKIRALSNAVIMDMAIWGIVGGLIGGRLFYVLFYALDYFILNPIEIFQFWRGGASSLGGLVGAMVGIILLACFKKISWRELFPYFDILSIGFWLGWGIGRLGCFFIHDHPGRLTNCWLAVNFPTATRYDLGLFESLLALLIFLFIFIWFKKQYKHAGRVFVVGFWIYSIVRFFLDFLRAEDLPQSDVRWLALTPAQWGMAVLFFILTFWLFRDKIRRKSQSID
ncbi:MAG: diacylglyceryl transferase [Candidatus Magasanikbacteria bacterium CG10_big_fil_rev_8_21_14_0_10_36_32]|uniref:Phosphatidylglycerol--prolipoprotein diacylglyceryl transferase n=1 Tax=Candidatus Magasanikbacteria bacterium CG10_big_fil_rev_8_21_14_0_10_36_32 TaxID=1974646 RepID=A0A2M6W604_9BACT|nr:MAG: diacylglyceryl transferase [Candidatus Magasanikbacteria bacterium CG10_big_fil_rev_8_21_14_0_10_36_32]